jgi:hypothetical protein
VKENQIRFKNRGFIVIWAAFYLMALFSPQLNILRGNCDFLAKYTAARILGSGQGEKLYHLETQKEVQRQVLVSLNSSVKFAGGLLLFSHPPFVVVLYVAVAWLSFVPAFIAWNVISGGCLVIGIACLLRHYRIQSPTDLELVVLSCLFFMPVPATLLQGQSTAVAFLCLVLAFLNLKHGRDFRGGLWLSLVLMKFQILPLLVLVFVVKRRGLALFGFAAGGVCLAVVSLLVVGPKGLLEYVTLLWQMSGWVDFYGVNPIGANCLRGQMYLLFYPTLPAVALSLTLLLNMIFVLLALVGWKGPWKPESSDFDLKFALLVVVGLLIAPQINFHDLVFLLLPGLILFHSASGETGQLPIRWILFAVGFPLQVLNFMALPIVPIQLNVIGLIAVATVLFHTIRSTGSARLSKSL